MKTPKENAITGRSRKPKAVHYDIETVKGKWPVIGFTIPGMTSDLAYRFAPDGKGGGTWVIDHLPTGLSVTGSARITKPQAVALLLRVGNLDWGKETAAKHGAALYAAMDDLMIDYGRGIRIKPGDEVRIDLSKMKDGESVIFRLG